MPTWRDVLGAVTQAYANFADQHPELVDADVAPGDVVTLSVDTDLGAVPVVVTVPAPLAPPVGQVSVIFKTSSLTVVDVAPPP